MYIGLGIVLLVLGLILAFDVITVDLSYVNDQALGVILIVCGVLAIVLSFAISDRYRRRRVVVDDRPVVERPVVERRTVADDPIVEERRY
ncbi:MAG: DUF6458 family protein [Marmoricola sp.]